MRATDRISDIDLDVTFNTTLMLANLFVRKRLLANEMSQMLWRVNYRDLVQLKDLVRSLFLFIYL